MKKAIILAFTVFAFHSVRAKDLVCPIEIVAVSADLIVFGEILSVNDVDYLFKVTEAIKGKSNPIISVKKNIRRVCAIRLPEQHQKGMKLYLFLKTGVISYETINGTYGELLIQNDKVETLRYYGLLDFGEFKTAIKNLAACYVFLGDCYNYTSYKLKQIVNNETLKKLSQENNFAKNLFAAVKKYKIE